MHPYCGLSTKSKSCPVDFQARYPDGNSELVQVCADASDPTTGARELRALLEAKQAHPAATLRLLTLTLTRDGAPADVPDAFSVEPAYVWMLNYPVE